MMGVDTNVLLRVLVEDTSAPEQSRLARDFMAGQKQVFVAQTVVPELAWVLQSVYRFEKAQLLAAFDELLARPQFVLEDREWLSAGIELFRANSMDFTDALILSGNRARSATLHTFDRKLAKLAGAQRLSA